MTESREGVVLQQHGDIGTGGTDPGPEGGRQIERMALDGEPRLLDQIA